MNEEYKQKTQDLVLPLFKALINSACINDGRRDSGNEIRNAKILKDFFNSYGIDSQIIEPLPSRASLIVKIKGSSKEAEANSFGFLNHIDVVPANASNWDSDPFCATEKDGYIYGRGAVDMLNITATTAVAFAEFIKSNPQPVNDLYYYALADEESEGILGALNLIKNHSQLTNCRRILTELGGFFLDNNGLKVGMNFSEKGVLRLKINVRGETGHGSLPYKKVNAATLLSKVLILLEEEFSRPVITELYQVVVAHLPFSEELKASLLDSQQIDGAIEEADKIVEGIGALLHSASRNTFSVGILKSGSKVNIIPDSAHAMVDIRLLPGYDDQMIIELVSGLVSDYLDYIEFEAREFFPAQVTSIDSEFFDLIDRSVKSINKDIEIVPVVPGGVTDGRYWRALGCEVFGFSLFAPDYTFKEFSDSLHGNNEKISIASLSHMFEFYSKFLDLSNS
ncbi:MAG: M20/M25/M40 family metallo-hydrolase [Spirochaetales bacterium]|nr:M20/M25/M40 family metallo-hydrolase [Spirochaetales bacterium]